MLHVLKDLEPQSALCDGYGHICNLDNALGRYIFLLLSFRHMSFKQSTYAKPLQLARRKCRVSFS